MKKTKYIALLCCVVPMLALAQDVKEEKAAKTFVPEQGDFAISFDAAPVLYYIGNMFNGNTDNTALNNGFQGSPTMSTVFERPTASIMAKYMLTNQLGARVNIGLLYRGVANRSYVHNDAYLQGGHEDDLLSEKELIDVQRTKTKGGSIAFGPEWRVGKKRVQGVFGADVLFAFQNKKIVNEWANGMSSVNQTPTSTGVDWNTASSRLLEHYNDGYNFYTGLVGHVGVEFFVAPKISLGAEVNISAYWQFAKQEYTKTEAFDAARDRVIVSTDLVAPKGMKEFYFGTENLGGTLYMSFYF